MPLDRVTVRTSTGTDVPIRKEAGTTKRVAAVLAHYAERLSAFATAG